MMTLAANLAVDFRLAKLVQRSEVYCEVIAMRDKFRAGQWMEV